MPGLAARKAAEGVEGAGQRQRQYHGSRIAIRTGSSTAWSSLIDRRTFQVKGEEYRYLEINTVRYGTTSVVDPNPK
jgi:hypothetical protein